MFQFPWYFWRVDKNVLKFFLGQIFILSAKGTTVLSSFFSVSIYLLFFENFYLIEDILSVPYVLSISRESNNLSCTLS